MPSSTILKFSLKIGSLKPDTFRVLEFTMTEAMSECFHLHIQASSENEAISFDDMIGKNATLTVTGDDFPVKHHGVVTEFNQYPDSSQSFGHESYLYDIVIEPHLKLLSYSSSSRAYTDKSILDIIEDVLKANGLTSANYKLIPSETYSPREFTVQYNETDLNFITRLMEDEGIFYFFDHEGDTDCMMIADEILAISPIANTPSVDLRPEGGLTHHTADASDHVLKLRRTQKMITGKATLKDYNYETPESNLIGSQNHPGQGEAYTYGADVKTAAAAEKKAKVRAEMYAAGKIQLDGEGIVRSFRTGFRFDLKEPEGGGLFKDTYTLVRVMHHGDQREGFEGDKDKIIYSNSFQCIPANVVFRPALMTAKPKIHGVLIARTDGPKDDYAYLDDQGRYKFRNLFDRTNATEGKLSPWTRMNQPYGGPGYGIHFPLHMANDLVLAFEDGDVDRPIAMGTAPSATNNSPVYNSVKTQNIIKTSSGHQITLDDKKDHTVIHIKTMGGHHIMMDDNKDGQSITITTTDKNILTFDDKKKNITMSTPEGAHKLEMDYDKKVFSVDTKYGHKLTMDDEAKAIALQTKDGHILKLDDDKKLIALQDGKGKHSIQIDADGSKVSINTEGDMTIAAKGKLDISAKEINVEAKQGAINLKAMKDVVLDGMNVSAKGKQKVSLEANMDASLKGLNVKLDGKVNVESKAGVQNKVTGVMTNVEASAINTVKGAMVMIN